MYNLRKRNNDEFNNILDENSTFKEYLPFSAEEYYCEEKFKEPREIKKFNEFTFENEEDEDTSENNKHKKTTTKDSNHQLKNEIQKRLPSSQTVNSIKSFISPASTASTAISVSSVATAAVVFIVATSIIFTNLGKFINVTSYMDYVLMNIDLVSITQEDKIYEINKDNFILDVMVDDSTITYDLKYGNFTYLIDGLDPNTSYDYTISYVNNDTSEKVVCYNDQVKTSSYSKPNAYFNDLYSSIVYNEEEDCLFVNCSIYISDYNKYYDHYRLAVCSSVQEDYDELSNVLYLDDNLENNYFNAQTNISKSNNVYLYVFGTKDNQIDRLLYKEFTFEFEIPTFEHDLSPYINVTSFNDCLLMDINLENILLLDEKYQDYKDSFILEIGSDNTNMELFLQENQLTYFVSGLEPNTTYQYSISYIDDSSREKVLCYQTQVNTLTYSDPMAFYDEYQNSFDYNEESEFLLSKYLIYISDYDKYYDNYQFVICSSIQDDYNNLRNILHENNEVVNNQFYHEASFIKQNKIYYYVFGIKDTSKELLLFKEFAFDFDIPVFEPDTASSNYISQPGSITINGSLIQYASKYEYFAYITQYDSNKNILIDGLSEGESYLEINNDDSTFTISTDICYGISCYQYAIYAIDSSDSLYCIYESEMIDYAGDQTYQGNLTMVSPNDASITYYNDHIVVSVDPHFYSDYDNYYYTLIAKNSENTIYGVYEGQGIANIEIYENIVIDTLNFEYIECGSFINGKIEYNTNTLAGPSICIPHVYLSEQATFNNNYFEITYNCDMIYDYSTAYLTLNILNGGEQYTKVVNNLSSTGTIVLDCIEGEAPSVNITCEFSFKDNQSIDEIHTITYSEFSYSLNYSFEVTEFKADYSTYESTIPILMKFNYQIPSNYKIKISDSQSTTDTTIDLCDEFYFNTISSSTTNIDVNIQVIDNNGTNWNSPIVYSINKQEADNIYNAATITMYSCNPGDSLVTYNDDGTINLYRLINFECDNENIYYNAFIYSSEDVDPSNGRTIYNNSYDSIGREKYSIIENIPDQMYIFHYYTLMDYNNVTYVMYMYYPSGVVNSGSVEAYAALRQSTDQPITTIDLKIGSYGYLDNRIIYNNNDVSFTLYENPTDSTFALTINDIVDVTEITIFYSEYAGEYDRMKNEIEIKGNLYRPYTIEVIVAEI